MLDITSLWAAFLPHFIVSTRVSQSRTGPAARLFPITFQLSPPANDARYAFGARDVVAVAAVPTITTSSIIIPRCGGRRIVAVHGGIMLWVGRRRGPKKLRGIFEWILHGLGEGGVRESSGPKNRAKPTERSKTVVYNGQRLKENFWYSICK